MEAFIKKTLVVDLGAKLSLDDIMRIMSISADLPCKFSRREVHEAIMESYPAADFKKKSGHKDNSHIGHYRLRWKTTEEMKAAAAVFVCTSSTYELERLSGILNLVEELPVTDTDVKGVKIGHSPNYENVVVMAQAAGGGVLPMYARSDAAQCQIGPSHWLLRVPL